MTCCSASKVAGDSRAFQRCIRPRGIAACSAVLAACSSPSRSGSSCPLGMSRSQVFAPFFIGFDQTFGLFNLQNTILKGLDLSWVITGKLYNNNYLKLNVIS
jgi:hypothetical protein